MYSPQSGDVPPEVMILVVILTYVLGNGFWSSPGDVGLPLSSSVKQPKIFYGNGDVSPFTFSLLLFLVSVWATFKHDEVCHVDEVLKVMDDVKRVSTRDDRPPELEMGCPLPRGVEPRLEIASKDIRHLSAHRFAPQRLKYRSRWRQEGLNLARPKGRDVI